MGCHGLPHMLSATVGLGVSLIAAFIPWTTSGEAVLKLSAWCFSDACFTVYTAGYFILTISGFVVTTLGVLLGWGAHCRSDKGGCGHGSFVAGQIVGVGLMLGGVFLFYTDLDDMGWLDASIPDSIKDEILAIDWKHITFGDLKGPFCIIAGSVLSLISVPFYFCCGYEPRRAKLVVSSPSPYVPMV